MQNSILEQVKVAQFGTDYIEREGQVSGTTYLVGQSGKMINFD